MELTELVGLNVRCRRIEKGMSAADLAERAKVERSCICRLESGACDPSVTLLFKIANALECSTVSLLRCHGEGGRYN